MSNDGTRIRLSRTGDTDYTDLLGSVIIRLISVICVLLIW